MQSATMLSIGMYISYNAVHHTTQFETMKCSIHPELDCAILYKSSVVLSHIIVDPTCHMPNDYLTHIRPMFVFRTYILMT